MAGVDHARQRPATTRSRLIHLAADQLAAAGAVVSRASWTRRQSSPSSSAESCAAVSRITPSSIAGQRNAPVLQTLGEEADAGAVPEHQLDPIGAPGAEHIDRPRERIGPHLLAHQGGQALGALAEVHRPGRHHHPDRSRRADHGDAFRALDHRRHGLRLGAAADPHRDPADLHLDEARRIAGPARPSRLARLPNRLRLRLLDHRRHEPRRTGIVAVLRRSTGGAPPAEQLLRRQPVTPGDLRHHRTRRQRLLDDPRLVVHRPAPTAADPVDDLHPPHRPRRLKRRVKSRHKPIPIHPGIGRLTPQRQTRKVGPEHRLPSPPRILRRQSLSFAKTIVGGRVVNDQNINLYTLLIEDAVNALLEKPTISIAWDHYAHRRPAQASICCPQGSIVPFHAIHCVTSSPNDMSSWLPIEHS